MTNFNILLFDGFETLDAFGPAEVIGQTENLYALKYYSLKGGRVISSQQIRVETIAYDAENKNGVWLIPGGLGTRKLVGDEEFIHMIHSVACEADFVLTVCTGAALLAKTKWLDGRRATSNKRAFDWVQSINEKVHWLRKARWVADGRFYTSSGISAGMDMTLGFLADRHGLPIAKQTAEAMEYIWHEDKETDFFSV